MTPVRKRQLIQQTVLFLVQNFAMNWRP